MRFPDWLRKLEARREASLRAELGLSKEEVERIAEAWRELIEDPESYAPTPGEPR